MKLYKFGVMSALVAAMGAHAGTDTTTFLVRIIVTEGCNIHSTAPTNVDFGTSLRATAVPEATGTINVLCTAGTAYAIALNNGNYYDAPNSTRRMSDGSGVNYVAYGLYQTTGTSTPWNAVNLKSGTGTGTTVPVAVYGSLGSGASNVPSGTYTDAVTATITY